MANYKGRKGRDDHFTGSGSADRFVFAPADLTSGDVIVGGDGAATDTLVFTAEGAITAEALANVSGIERIDLSDAGNSIVLTTGLVQTSGTRTLTIVGGDGNDVIDARGVVASGDFRHSLALFGGAGDDVIYGAGAGEDGIARVFEMVDGGVGVDTIDLSAAPAERTYVVCDGADIRETVQSGTLLLKGSAAIDLTRVSDQSIGDRCVVTGFDSVDASSSSDAVRITGIDGIGTLVGSDGADTITGGLRIIGGKGADTLIGGTSQNSQFFEIWRGDFAAGERIIGNSDSDILTVIGSADFRTGTLRGIDAIQVYASDTHKTHITLFAAQLASVDAMIWFQPEQSRGVFVDAYMDDEHRFENTSLRDATIHGTGQHDTIIVGDLSVIAGAGDDVISGYGDIRAGDGDDTVKTSIGAVDNLIDGGAGTDTLEFMPGWLRQVTIDLGARGDQTSNDNPVIRNFENVDLSQVGTSEGSHITGSAAANHIIGSAGKDDIDGGAGDDVISGGSGKDTLRGGLGSDVMSGGDFADRFVFGSLAMLDGNDRITDFSHEQGDRIDLSRVDADEALDGIQRFTFIGTDAFTGATGSDYELRYQPARSSGNLLVQGDVDHDGIADFSIIVHAPALQASDFIL